MVRRSEWDDRAAYRIASNTSRSAGFGLEAETAHLKRYLGITDVGHHAKERRQRLHDDDHRSHLPASREQQGQGQDHE